MPHCPLPVASSPPAALPKKRPFLRKEAGWARTRYTRQKVNSDNVHNEPPRIYVVIIRLVNSMGCGAGGLWCRGPVVPGAYADLKLTIMALLLHHWRRPIAEAAITLEVPLDSELVCGISLLSSLAVSSKHLTKPIYTRTAQQASNMANSTADSRMATTATAFEDRLKRDVLISRHNCMYARQEKKVIANPNSEHLISWPCACSLFEYGFGPLNWFAGSCTVSPPVSLP